MIDLSTSDSMHNDAFSIPIAGINRLKLGTDGKGIRTLVATYGCPLRCKYCINPLTWNGKKTPKIYTIQELYDEVNIDNLYFRATNGGITFGGGEPLIHAKFIRTFINECPKEWSFVAETSLNVSRDNIKMVIDLFDEVHVDIKTLDEEKYYKYTGKPLELALDNLVYLLRESDPNRIIVRIPEIPRFTTCADQHRYAETLNRLGFERLDIFRYSVNTI